MIVFDSNVWIALFDEDDSQHNKALKILKQRDKARIIVTEYIILEVSTVLLAKAYKARADKFLEIISDNSDTEILLSSREFFLNVLRRFQQNTNAKLSFIDISLLQLAGQHDIITFDTGLQKALQKTS